VRVSVKAIDALLPQTQCGECGYSGCLPYAEALAQGKASIDRCPPGGEATLKALGKLLGVATLPANIKTRPPTLALIREAECIGCTKCIQACPVDAIIGSGKLMHAVIATECTGCGLCVEPCPVDCIELVAISKSMYDKAHARRRFNAKQTRLLQEEREKQQAYQEKRKLVSKSTDAILDIKAKQEYIRQALARVQTRKNK
jgi:Na+-translocating ferredoxin:NAD+ oxidoreductase subunit B